MPRIAKGETVEVFIRGNMKMQVFDDAKDYEKLQGSDPKTLNFSSEVGHRLRNLFIIYRNRAKR